jgi:ABC-type multidrug transport system fused ATPase/permease subunit
MSIKEMEARMREREKKAEERVRRDEEEARKDQEAARKKVDDVFDSSRKAFTDMRVMNWVVFVVSVFLVALAVWLGVTGQQAVYALLFGTLGIFSLVAMLFRPMWGVRDALCDFLQAHMTFESFNQQVGVWWEVKGGGQETLRHFQTVAEAREASQDLERARETSVRLLQEMLKEKEPKAPATPSITSAKQDVESSAGKVSGDT